MITKGLFSSNTDEWYTPLDFFKALDREFHFNLDPCATDGNHKCDKYFTREIDGLSQKWGGTECSAIHLTDVLLVTGLKRLMRNHNSLIHWLLC